MLEAELGESQDNFVTLQYDEWNCKHDGLTEKASGGQTKKLKWAEHKFSLISFRIVLHVNNVGRIRFCTNTRRQVHPYVFDSVDWIVNVAHDTGEC